MLRMPASHSASRNTRAGLEMGDMISHSRIRQCAILAANGPSPSASTCTGVIMRLAISFQNETRSRAGTSAVLTLSRNAIRSLSCTGPKWALVREASHEALPLASTRCVPGRWCEAGRSGSSRAASSTTLANAVKSAPPSLRAQGCARGNPPPRGPVAAARRRPAPRPPAGACPLRLSAAANPKSKLRGGTLRRHVSRGLIRDGRRETTAGAMLRPALARGNVHVQTDAQVARIVIEDGRGAGVELLDGRVIRARREVALSAGTVQTPQILLLSGIGPAQHLRDIGIEPLTTCPAWWQLSRSRRLADPRRDPRSDTLWLILQGFTAQYAAPRVLHREPHGAARRQSVRERGLPADGPFARAA